MITPIVVGLQRHGRGAIRASTARPEASGRSSDQRVVGASRSVANSLGARPPQAGRDDEGGDRPKRLRASRLDPARAIGKPTMIRTGTPRTAPGRRRIQIQGPDDDRQHRGDDAAAGGVERRERQDQVIGEGARRGTRRPGRGADVSHAPVRRAGRGPALRSSRRSPGWQSRPATARSGPAGVQGPRPSRSRRACGLRGSRAARACRT